MISADDLERVRALIYKETGMRFDERKDYYLSSRIEDILSQSSSPDIRDFLHQITFANSKEDLHKLIEAVTINETYFFRDFPQLKGFAEDVLGKYVDGRKVRSTSLRVWCAACSTGEEAYTLAIILLEMLEQPDRFSIEISATDIDRNVLKTADTAVYGTRSMKDTPLPYRQKYFEETGEGWHVKPQLRRMIEFSQLNLNNRGEMRSKRNYDFIFCRNVLIYFDEESRKKVVGALYDALVPGGYLFLGHSESVGRITAAFELDRIGNFLCYKKPGV